MELWFVPEKFNILKNEALVFPGTGFQPEVT